jgi:hypothetical protein
MDSITDPIKLKKVQYEFDADLSGPIGDLDHTAQAQYILWRAAPINSSLLSPRQGPQPQGSDPSRSKF